jgi:hypothetical protein
MWNFSIGRSLSILGATYPFILLRILIYFGITGAYLFATGAGAGFGYGLGRAFANNAIESALWGGLFGFGVVSVALYFIREYILYLVKAGHIAMMVELYDGRSMPPGKSQIAHGKDRVAERFGETNMLFALDQLVKGVVAAITRAVWALTSFIPIPGLHSLVKFANMVVRVAVNYIDEIILAHDIRINSQNPWSTAQDALVLYAQNNRIIIKNAIWLAIFMNVIACLIFLIMLAPAAAILYFFPGSWSGFAFVLAFLIAWSFKKALLEPFAIASLMQVYFQAIEGQEPDPDWRARLEDISKHFRNLGTKARDWAGGSQSGSQTRSSTGHAS